jgi:hypothetical protein
MNDNAGPAKLIPDARWTQGKYVLNLRLVDSLVVGMVEIRVEPVKASVWLSDTDNNSEVVATFANIEDAMHWCEMTYLVGHT